jgi:hypothetical protein
MAVAPPLASLLLALLLVLPSALSAGGGDAHPGYPSGEGTCTVDSAGGGLRLPERGGPGRIIDITHAYVPDLPAFAPGAVAGPVVRLKHSMAEGSEYNLSELRMECHTGTHVDAPGHINQDNFAAGLDVDTLDLDVLNGNAASSSSQTPPFAGLWINCGIENLGDEVQRVGIKSRAGNSEIPNRSPLSATTAKIFLKPSS